MVFLANMDVSSWIKYIQFANGYKRMITGIKGKIIGWQSQSAVGNPGC